MAASPAPAALRSLESATRNYPVDRKLLVAPSMGIGRELLRALVTRGCSWVGWEITTPRRLALDIAGPGLAAEGLALADRYDEQAAIDAALDLALADAPISLRDLGEGVGFRDAVANSVGALRLAGITPDRLRRAAGCSADVRELLAAVLATYADHLSEERRVDTADLFVRATAELDRSSGVTGEARVFLLCGLPLGGRSGDLVRALRQRGAVTIAADPVHGAELPPVLWEPAGVPAPLSGILATPPEPALHGELRVELFCASGPAEELREVLRRAMAAGLRWDEVEIVATDPVVYGGALHALARRLGVPVSYGVGLPVERTRPGRAAAAYLRWLADGCPADVIRQLLEAGDLVPPPPHEPGSRAHARRLRRLRIGRGHDRYLPAIDRALAALPRVAEPDPDETTASAEARLRRERAQLEALRALLEPLLEATPRLDPGDPHARVSPARLADGLRRFLERVPDGDSPSATARRRLLAIADRVAATLTRPTTPAAAVAILRGHLEIRVPAPEREGSAPWGSAPGHLHLTDVEHGGFTGRGATFVVGLDAERFPGRGLQDPLLLDAHRRALDPVALPTSGDRLAAGRFRLAALLARLRGDVALSYSAWDPAEGRAVAPSAILLQAFRLEAGDASLTFQDLHERLGDPASVIPRGSGLLDGADVWLHALDRGGLFRAGQDVVRRAYARLDAGLNARAALKGDVATAHHGRLSPRPTLDPRRNPELVVSASGIQDLGTCGLRYLYKYVLRARPPDDPDPDPDRWLSAMDRGRLLHRVYERTLREARASGVPLEFPALPDLATGVLEEEADRMRREIPPPGEAVLARELEELREDARSFAHMVSETGAEWVELERKFGFEGSSPAVLGLRGGEVRLRGAIDRVDRTARGLRVIDYKTGRPDDFRPATGVFHGGRRVQNVVYSAVAELLLGARVERMEYHFPTRRGENAVRAYGREELARGRALLDRLFDLLSRGLLLPTDDAGDCRYCDYAAICRVRHTRWSHASPLAEWAAERIGSAPEYEPLRAVRRFEEWTQPELGEDGPA